MTFRKPTFIATVIAAGLVVALFIFFDITPFAKHDAGTLRAGYKGPDTAVERFKPDQEDSKGRVATTLEHETSQLLAAGFSMDLIAWIRKRTDELATEFLQKEDQDRQQGRFDMDAHLIHKFDSDIDLRHELGDEQYAKYRRALGRPIGMKVEKVSAGGFGEHAGLKLGDEITEYNGIRIFNAGELSTVIAKHMISGEPVTLDVMRDGLSIRLIAPSGDLRIGNPPLLPATVDLPMTSEEMGAEVLERSGK